MIIIFFKLPFANYANGANMDEAKKAVIARAIEKEITRLLNNQKQQKPR